MELSQTRTLPCHKQSHILTILITALHFGLVIGLLSTILACSKPPMLQPEKTKLKLLFWNPDTVAKVRHDIRRGTFNIPAVTSLQLDAKRMITKGPFSVIDKRGVPPSGDKHDYMSLSTYYWPDPNSPDGKPYVYRDGEVSPEFNSDLYDSIAMFRMVSAVRTLSQAYYFLDDDASGDRAALLLRTWFINPATRMNPHLEYAHGVPSKYTGSPWGIIETHILLDVLDAAAFIADCPSWTPEDQKALKKWFSDYVKWLQNSEKGKREAVAKNNHGTWYDTQVTAFALFAENTELAFNLLKSSLPQRIASQIEPDGRQPLELERTRPLHYSVFNLKAFIYLALLGEHVGLDFWNYSTSDGRSIRKALDFVIPYLDGKEWPYQQIIKENFRSFAPFLYWAALRYREKTYADVADRLLDDKFLTHPIHLLFPRFPAIARRN